MSIEKTTYRQIDDAIKEAPMTYLPALLLTCVQTAITKGCFREPDGLVNFVKEVKAREAAKTILSSGGDPK